MVALAIGAGGAIALVISLAVLGIAFAVVLRNALRAQSEAKALAAQLRRVRAGGVVEEGSGHRLGQESSKKSSVGSEEPAPAIPDALVDALAHNECVLFAGGGVAASAGYPGWQEVLRGLILRAGEVSAEKPLTDALLQQLDAGQSELVAQILSGRLETRDVAGVIRESFSRPLRPASGLIEALTVLPFAGVVTDDYSTIIPDAFARRQPSTYTLESLVGQSHLLRGKDFFVLQAYGAVEDPPTVCLSFDDYSRRLNEIREASLFMGGLLGSRTMLFIGTSVSGVEQFCIASGVRTRGDREHFALVPELLGTGLEAERLFNLYGLRLLSYKSEVGHAPVLDFVRDLHRATQNRAGSSVRAPERLERVELINIGPFKELELTFDRDWNVLLGNNAVGKTTILRAVALGLAGDSPATATAPARLLRAGADSGRITLTLGRSSYTTILSREGDIVSAHSEQITPVRSGSWLAVGLPALRGVPKGGRSHEKARTSANPSPTDIVPLMRDEVDARIDDIKEWIATHWLRSLDGDSPDALRHRGIVESFFKILRQLTPGVSFELTGVDARSNRICINTPDGEITLDELSLGMASMIGGVGVLLQRLYEIFPNDDAPESRTALLLVNEIDAHLHPLWQTRLLSVLRDTFPNLHLLATTHSPLIVANAAGGELHHLRRDGDRVVAEKIEMPFEGWRADQILTGPAFDLDTTVDRTTAAKLKEYRHLQSTANQSAEQQERLGKLARELGATLPRPQETADQREAVSLLEEWLDERLRNAMTPEQRERLTIEVRAELQRIQALGDGGR